MAKIAYFLDFSVGKLHVSSRNIFSGSSSSDLSIWITPLVSSFFSSFVFLPMQNEAKHIERMIIPTIDLFNVLFMIFIPNRNGVERLEYFCTWIDNFHCLLQFIMIVVIHFGASKNDPVPNDYYK